MGHQISVRMEVALSVSEIADRLPIQDPEMVRGEYIYGVLCTRWCTVQGSSLEWLEDDEAGPPILGAFKQSVTVLIDHKGPDGRAEPSYDALLEEVGRLLLAVPCRVVMQNVDVNWFVWDGSTVFVRRGYFIVPAVEQVFGRLGLPVERVEMQAAW